MLFRTRKRDTYPLSTTLITQWNVQLNLSSYIPMWVAILPEDYEDRGYLSCKFSHENTMYGCWDFVDFNNPVLEDELTRAAQNIIQQIHTKYGSFVRVICI